jgi:ABC-2 type transport system ATP-binding protein
MAAISLQGVTKTFRVGRPWGVKDALLGSKGHRHRSQEVRAVSEVTFEITAGETTALLGHNGSGKSTTLKLLAGTIAPTSGIVRAHGRIAPLLELGAGFHPDLTGRENVFLNAALLGVRRKYVREHLDEIIDFSGLEDFIDTPVRFYSSGMAARLGFAVAVHVEPEIVLLDEVLAVGDAGFQEKCLSRMERMKAEGRTLILVTHSLPQAQDFCSRALVLEQGRLVFDGPVGKASTAYNKSTHLGPLGVTRD